MRMKTKTIDKTMSIESQNKNPGAGSYENPEAMSARGKYSVSKHRGSGATLFNPKRSTRFFQFSTFWDMLENTIPGPGAYEQINNLSDRGHYTNSNMVGYGKRMFDKEHRVMEAEKKARKNAIPGPGSYRLPSDFGQYDGEVYDRSESLYQRTNNNSRVSKQYQTIRSSRVGGRWSKG